MGIKGVFLCIVVASLCAPIKGQVVVEKLHIRSDIASRFANTLVTSTLRNVGNYIAEEVFFDVQLPKAAFIANFSMLIDDDLYYGKVKGKVQAQKQYNTAKKKGESAGLVKQVGKDPTKFRVSVNVAVNSSVTFNLTYQELLKRRLGLYDHVIFLTPNHVVPDMKVDVYIAESRKIKELKPLRYVRDKSVIEGYSIKGAKDLQAVVNWLSESSVHIGYYPSENEQVQLGTMAGFTGERLILSYDVERSLSAGEVMAVDGYFVHFVAPSGLKPIPKKIVFVLDTSGSMSGSKDAQMKQAMLAILKDLRDIDTFNIVDFDSDIETWKPHLVPVTEAHFKEAAIYVNGMIADSGTNIGDGMKTALRLLKKDEEKGMPMIMFLTDGQPSVGIVNKEHLTKVITDANGFGVRIMSLAFGDGADYNLLQIISGKNNGVARKIYTDADAALQLEGFYDEVSTPVLSNVKVKYLADAVQNETVTTTDFDTLFEGSEIVVSGKFSDLSGPTFDLSLEGDIADGELILDETAETSASLANSPSASTVSRFTERLWAYLTIKQLLEDEILATAEEQETVKSKVMDLSLKYGFVTPYTSMVVTKADKIEKPEKESQDSPESARTTPPSPRPLPQSRSKWASSAGYTDNDPHFVMSLPGLELPICFDVMGHNGDYFTIVSDQASGIQVHGRVFARNPGSQKTYFSSIVVKTKQFTLKATPEFVQVQQTKVKWRENTIVRYRGGKVGIFGRHSITLHLAKDIQFVIMKHQRTLRKVGKVQFMGFYMNRATGLSNQATGLLGEFRHRIALHADIQVKGGNYTAELALMNTMTLRVDVVTSELCHRPDLEHDITIWCWKLQTGFLDAREDQYVFHRNQSNSTI